MRQNSYSEAMWNHKAFTWYPSRKLLALPISNWSSNSYDSELRVLSIDTTKGISDLGAVNVKGKAATVNSCYSWWANQAMVQRSIFADNYVYAISNMGIKVADVTNLNTAVSNMEFSADATLDAQSCTPNYYYE